MREPFLLFWANIEGLIGCMNAGKHGIELFWLALRSHEKINLIVFPIV